MSFLTHIDVDAKTLPVGSLLHAFDGAVAFDAYTATTTEATADDVYNIVAYGADQRESRLRGHHHFEFRDIIRDGGGDLVASIYYGGQTHGKRVMLDVKGWRTTDAVRDLRKAAVPHRCTRVDSRMDFDGPRAFERLLKPLLSIKARKNLYGDRGGDWDHPEQGRTQYCGSTKSAVRVRLYEKGKQPEHRHMKREDWTRLEIQVRPQGETKERFATITPLEAWGAAEWTRELAAEILMQHIDPLKAEKIKPPSADEQKLRWMCRQYGAPLIGLLQHYEGDLASFGGHINTVLNGVRDEDEHFRKLKGKA